MDDFSAKALQAVNALFPNSPVRTSQAICLGIGLANLIPVLAPSIKSATSLDFSSFSPYGWVFLCLFFFNLRLPGSKKELPFELQKRYDVIDDALRKGVIELSEAKYRRRQILREYIQAYVTVLSSQKESVKTVEQKQPEIGGG